MTIDKVWLTEVVASLPRRTIAKVNHGLKLSLGLGNTWPGLTQLVTKARARTLAR